MKFYHSIILTSFVVQGTYSSIIAERQICNANNCLRLIRGTDANQRPTLASRQADCSSFMRVTVTPATTTTTVTSIVTVTLAEADKRNAEGINLDLVPRQMTGSPSAIPTYAASACQSSAAYSSACSCAGITKSTTTLPAPTSTVTTIATQTVCPGTNTICLGICKNLDTDPTNCGACGRICPTSNTCKLGVCTPPSLPDNSCSNAQICDYNSQCSGSNGCTGFCQPDADGVGRCGNDQAAVLCSTQVEKKCNKNSDCVSGTGGYCIDDCCGFKSCYYLSNSAFCVNGADVSRLFRKKTTAEVEGKTGQPVKGATFVG